MKKRLKHAVNITFVRKTVYVIFFIVISTFIMSAESLAATYFVDFQNGLDSNSGTSKSAPWKRSPGMLGFSGNYKHSPGDKFIFKGNVVWSSNCFPLKYKNDGLSIIDPDLLTSDETYFNGDSFGKPVFDGGATIPLHSGLIDIDGRKYVTIKGIKIQNVGVKGKLGNSYGIRGVIGEGITIEDCEIIGYCRHGIAIHYTAEKQIQSGFKIINCKISKVSNSIESGISREGNNLINAVEITGNEFFDPKDQLVEGDHGDGIHIFNVQKGKLPLYKNVLIKNNKFFGDWSGSDLKTTNTAQIYLESGVINARLESNIHTFSNTSTMMNNYLFSPGFIVAGASEKIDILNNAICAANMAYKTGSYGVMHGITVSGKNIIITGNRIFGTRIGIGIKSGYNSLVIDSNLISPRAGDGIYGVIDNKTWLANKMQWQALGFDKSEVEGDIYNLACDSKNFLKINTPTGMKIIN